MKTDRSLIFGNCFKTVLPFFTISVESALGFGDTELKINVRLFVIYITKKKKLYTKINQ